MAICVFVFVICQCDFLRSGIFGEGERGNVRREAIWGGGLRIEGGRLSRRRTWWVCFLGVVLWEMVFYSFIRLGGVGVGLCETCRRVPTF